MAKGKMTRCEKCGKPFAAAVKACPYCGAKNKLSKPSVFKTILSVLAIFFVIGIVTSIFSGEKDDGRQNEDTGREENISTDQEPDTDADPVDEQEALREQFNESLGEGSALFYKNVRNDVTGRWRLFLFHSGENIVDHAIDYYSAYFESDDEVHLAVNLGLKTTSVITCSAGCLFVDVHEYIDKEEHDAKILGSGMLLKQYIIDLSSGEIDDISSSTD